MLRFKPLFSFGTKAESLNHVACRLTKSVVPAFRFFTYADWQAGRSNLIDELPELRTSNLLMTTKHFLELVSL